MYTVLVFLFFFFNDTATTEIYTLSLHDALPISAPTTRRRPQTGPCASVGTRRPAAASGVGTRRSNSDRVPGDRKSTRLNSSHSQISYAVFCLKKKKKKKKKTILYHINPLNLYIL